MKSSRPFHPRAALFSFFFSGWFQVRPSAARFAKVNMLGREPLCPLLSAFPSFLHPAPSFVPQHPPTNPGGTFEAARGACCPPGPMTPVDSCRFTRRPQTARSGPRAISESGLGLGFHGNSIKGPVDCFWEQEELARWPGMWESPGTVPADPPCCLFTPLMNIKDASRSARRISQCLSVRRCSAAAWPRLVDGGAEKDGGPPPPVIPPLFSLRRLHSAARAGRRSLSPAPIVRKQSAVLLSERPPPPPPPPSH